jgi:hypothetical protein
MAADSSGLLPGEIQPVQYGINLTVFDPADRTQAVALNQHGHDIQQEWTWSAQRFKERTPVSTERALTVRAVQASLSVTVDLDVVSANSAKVKAEGIVTPLNVSLHRASFLSG